jgi:hypothetical protein
MANDDEKVTNEDVERDVPYFKSDLEDIDFAVYNFLDDFMDVNVKTNKGFKKVPVIWSGSERSQNIKTPNIERDSLGQIILPVISVERTNIKKDPTKNIIPYASVDPVGDLKGGYLTVNRVIQQDKTRNFLNADSFRRRGDQNYPLKRFEKNNKVVYETLTIPIPIYVEVSYNIVMRTEYQEQMNDLLTPYIRITNGHQRVILEHNNNQYEGFISGDYNFANNISNYSNAERKYETTLSMRVVGYLIGDTKNQKQPRVVRRENAVQIRFASERIIMQDDDGEFRF